MSDTFLTSEFSCLTHNTYAPIEQKSDIEILLERIIALESKVNFIELRLQESGVDLYDSN